MVLPVERTAVIIVAAALDHVVMEGPWSELLNGIRQHRHVVVHDPEPFGAELIRFAHAVAETAGTADVAFLREVHHTVHVAFRVSDGLPPLGG